MHYYLTIQKNKNMKRDYYKPQMEVVYIEGRHQLLSNYSSEMKMDMSGYRQGGNGEINSDGWSD